MLHRTQVKQVVNVYSEFLAACPTLSDYSQQDTKEIRLLLAPLGLQWRIDAMIEALNYLWETYKEVPLDRSILLSVPGIGPYIAGATICFTTNMPETLVDTNTVRVVGRVFGLNLGGEARRRKQIIQTISEVCDREQPRDYYYAMIDLAHSVCTSANPGCARCPLLNLPCKYGQHYINASNRSQM